MDLIQLWRNVKISYSITNNISDTLKYLALNYERLFKYFWLSPVIKISYNLHQPIGKINLLHRFNRGADLYIFSEVFIERGYDIDLKFPPKTILDLGANVGYSCIFFKHKFPLSEIIVVEPIDDNIKILNENIRINNLNVNIVEGAISVQSGFAYMENVSKDYGYKITAQPTLNDKRVKAYTVSELVAQYKWESIDLLKIDIEGYEKYLLKENNSWLMDVNNIILEIHFSFFDEQDIIELVNTFKFKGYRIINGLYFIFRK